MYIRLIDSTVASIRPVIVFMIKEASVGSWKMAGSGDLPEGKLRKNAPHARTTSGGGVLIRFGL